MGPLLLLGIEFSFFLFFFFSFLRSSLALYGTSLCMQEHHGLNHHSTSTCHNMFSLYIYTTSQKISLQLFSCVESALFA